ncbi:MAG: hypothetical protein JWP02_2146 [Acidimicrobiales bacterium]|nr:hypothetical protein [Acidimicrobiales bacterium]
MSTLAERQVAHVWRRLGFGPNATDISNGAAVGPKAVIADLLSRPLTGPTDWQFTTSTDYTGESKFLGRQLNRMGYSSNPAQERLAWILQGLVVVGIDGTVYFSDMADHILRLRADPFGSYKQLLTAVTTSAGMMKYLSGYQNSKQHPNQNYARELMELFSLGLTHPTTGAANYSENDVREVARALTGYKLNWSTGTISFDPSLYDSGSKTFLGKIRGNAGVTEVIDAVSTHPSWQYHVPRRMYRELVGLEPDTPTLDSLASTFGPGGDIKGLVAAIVNLPAFLSDAAIGAKAKTPVELLVAASKVLGIDLTNLDFSWQLRDLMGLHPFLPPNVSGWPAGKRWLNTSVSMTWCAIVQGLVATARNTAGSVVAQLAASGPATAPATAARLCGITDLSTPTADALASYASGSGWSIDRAAGSIALVLMSPEFAVN